MCLHAPQMPAPPQVPEEKQPMEDALPTACTRYTQPGHTCAEFHLLFALHSHSTTGVPNSPSRGDSSEGLAESNCHHCLTAAHDKPPTTVQSVQLSSKGKGWGQGTRLEHKLWKLLVSLPPHPMSAAENRSWPGTFSGALRSCSVPRERQCGSSLPHLQSLE